MVVSQLLWAQTEVLHGCTPVDFVIKQKAIRVNISQLVLRIAKPPPYNISQKLVE